MAGRILAMPLQPPCGLVDQISLDSHFHHQNEVQAILQVGHETQLSLLDLDLTASLQGVR